MVAKNKEQLIHIAAKLFLTQGYKYTSIEDVVEVSGVSRSNLYYHFNSKEELLFAVVDFWGNRYESALEVSLGDIDIPVRQRIEDFVELLLSEIEFRGNKGNCPFIAMYEQSSFDAEQVHQRIRLFFTRLHALIESLIEQGMYTGEFSRIAGAKQAAYLFVSSLEGSLILAETMNDISIVRTTSNSFFSFLSS